MVNLPASSGGSLRGRGSIESDAPSIFVDVCDRLSTTASEILDPDGDGFGRGIPLAMEADVLHASWRYIDMSVGRQGCTVGIQRQDVTVRWGQLKVLGPVEDLLLPE